MRLTARDAAIRRIEDKLEKNWTKGAVVLGLAFGNRCQASPCLNASYTIDCSTVIEVHTTWHLV
jgi:hypothetical protein